MKSTEGAIRKEYIENQLNKGKAMTRNCNSPPRKSNSPSFSERKNPFISNLLFAFVGVYVLFDGRGQALAQTAPPTGRNALVPTNLDVSTTVPTLLPSSLQTPGPTSDPTGAPTTSPIVIPTSGPTNLPTVTPTSPPTNQSTDPPTLSPTNEPTETPITSSPTASQLLTNPPTDFPTAIATTLSPTVVATPQPTEEPTPDPTREPTSMPTISPTATTITSEPTLEPTEKPTSEPTAAPSISTTAPSTPAPTVQQPTPFPTYTKIRFTSSPTATPTTNAPTLPPTPILVPPVSDGTILFETNMHGDPTFGYNTILQTDGNLVTRTTEVSGGDVVWSSNSVDNSGSGQYFLALNVDLSISIYRGTKSNIPAAYEIWTSSPSNSGLPDGEVVTLLEQNDRVRTNEQLLYPSLNVGLLQESDGNFVVFSGTWYSSTSNPTSLPAQSMTPYPTYTKIRFTSSPTRLPTPTSETAFPTIEPTTSSPTKKPSAEPTARPTNQPTKETTEEPTTLSPTVSPGNPTKKPTKNPTRSPTTSPTRSPTKNPTKQPTTDEPTVSDMNPVPPTSTKNPTKNPTKQPATNEPTASDTNPLPTQNDVGMTIFESGAYANTSGVFNTLLQDDGNLITRTTAGKGDIVWKSGSGSGSKGGEYFMALNVDRSVSIYRGTPKNTSKEIWTTKPSNAGLPSEGMVVPLLIQTQRVISGEPLVYPSLNVSLVQQTDGNFIIFGDTSVTPIPTPVPTLAPTPVPTIVPTSQHTPSTQTITQAPSSSKNEEPELVPSPSPTVPPTLQESFRPTTAPTFPADSITTVAPSASPDKVAAVVYDLSIQLNGMVSSSTLKYSRNSAQQVDVLLLSPEDVEVFEKVTAEWTTDFYKNNNFGINDVATSVNVWGQAATADNDGIIVMYTQDITYRPTYRSRNIKPKQVVLTPLGTEDRLDEYIALLQKEGRYANIEVFDGILSADLVGKFNPYTPTHGPTPVPSLPEDLPEELLQPTATTISPAIASTEQIAMSICIAAALSVSLILFTCL